MCSANNENLRIFIYICHALPISRVRIAAPMVLVQCKGCEEMGEAQKHICRAVPIGLEIAL